jgi:2-dehydro-3-deoxyphosphogluconate aldolase/(4S)-4-hydroxy-2-oxoglutarate aldolase
MDNFMPLLMQERFVIIYRGFNAEECVEMTEVLLEAGVRHFEVTMNKPQAMYAIERLNALYREDAYIGAGTVLHTEEVEAVYNAGGRFIVSPNTNVEVIRETKRLGMVSMPGAFTPTEIQTAWHAGADVVKVFPINVVGAEYIKQIKGPLNDILFMATGGVTLDRVGGLFEAGVMSIGLGVHLLGRDIVENRSWKAMKLQMAAFQQAAGVSAEKRVIS